MKQWLPIMLFFAVIGCGTGAQAPQAESSSPRELFVTLPDSAGPLSVTLENSQDWRTEPSENGSSWTASMRNVRTGARINITPVPIVSEELLVIEGEASMRRWAFATGPCEQQSTFGNWTRRTCVQKRHTILQVDGEVVWLQFDRLPNVTIVIDGWWGRGDTGAKYALEQLVATAQIVCSPGNMHCR